MGGCLSGVFRCGVYFCIYRRVLNGVQVAVEMSNRTDFERGAPPLPQCSKREVVRLLSHNVFRLAAVWPRCGVLAYERGDGGSLRDQKLSKGDG